MKHKLAPDFFRNYNFVLFSDPRDWLQPKMGQQVGFIQNGGMDTKTDGDWNFRLLRLLDSSV